MAFFMLTNAVKRRMIRELKDSFSRHPVYRRITDNISNKYPQAGQIQEGIVVRNASGNPLVLSADHFQATVRSHVGMSKIHGHHGNSIEWVRENHDALRANDGEFPAPAGIYVVEITDHFHQDGHDEFEFMVDPILVVNDESLGIVTAGDLTPTYALANAPIMPGSLSVWMDGDIRLRRSVHYTVDESTGEVTFLEPLPVGATLTADYRYAVASRGPYRTGWNQTHLEAVPGAVLAFGRRIEVGDKSAVVIYPHRVDVAEEFGGQWNISMDMDIYARDPIVQEELSDLCVQYLYVEKRETLAEDGIRLDELSQGGESDEIYDGVTDEPYFMASISMTLVTDWNIQVGVPHHIAKFEVYNHTELGEDVSEESLAALPKTMQLVDDATGVAILNRNADFERIR